MSAIILITLLFFQFPHAILHTCPSFNRLLKLLKILAFLAVKLTVFEGYFIQHVEIILRFSLLMSLTLQTRVQIYDLDLDRIDSISDYTFWFV